MDEAEKQKEAGEAAVREQREAEEGDTTMAEPEPEAPAEVFSVDGSEQLQREAEAESQAQRDAEAEDETMEEPRVVGTVPPMEVFKDQPGDFPEQDVTSQPGKGIKGEKMDDSGEEEKEEPKKRVSEVEAPTTTKKPAIDPSINQSTENFSTPGIRISRKDHAYTDKQAAEILKGEGGVDLAFGD